MENTKPSGDDGKVDFLTCPVCLETFKEPLSLRCNHSFCSECLDSSWRQNSCQTCPVCRRTSSKEVVVVNFALRELAVSLEDKAKAEEVECGRQPEEIRLFCLDAVSDLRVLQTLCDPANHDRLITPSSTLCLSPVSPPHSPLSPLTPLSPPTLPSLPPTLPSLPPHTPLSPPHSPLPPTLPSLPPPHSPLPPHSLPSRLPHRELLLSEDKRSVRRVKEQLCPRHEDRFMDQPQVLSCTGLRGRCYWEVEWREDVDVAVSYRGIRRRGESCRFGDNDQSWSLRVRGKAFSVCHNEKETRIPRWYFTSGLGVFLDSEAGVLSFYEVAPNKLLHLHTFSCSFTEPLFPGFGLISPGSSVALMNPPPVGLMTDM
uniref:Uncharacterized protein n=1 Tax=Neogobius melanostomus TaxID=47308 RepID=A0A8C6TLD7_9GOBI